MVAILVDGKKDGETGWIATRGLSKVKVSGIAGCTVRIMCLEKMDTILITEDGEYNLPEGTDFVKVRHTETTEESKVYVDLVR